MKRFLIIAWLVVLSFIASAQTAYTDGGVYKIDSTLTLKCNFSITSFTLSDKAHENDKTPPGWDLTWDFFSDKNCKIVSNANLLRAMRESFTQEQINDLAAKDENVIIGVYWNHLGDIINLIIGMSDNATMKAIPVATYAALYTKFKQYVKFKIVSPNYKQPSYTLMFRIRFSAIKNGDINLE